jgi:hypothetical protein
MPMKKSTDTIGNRTRDLPVCSAVPQPTAPPRPLNIIKKLWGRPFLLFSVFRFTNYQMDFDEIWGGGFKLNIFGRI